MQLPIAQRCSQGLGGHVGRVSQDVGTAEARPQGRTVLGVFRDRGQEGFSAPNHPASGRTVSLKGRGFPPFRQRGNGCSEQTSAGQ